MLKWIGMYEPFLIYHPDGVRLTNFLSLGGFFDFLRTNSERRTRTRETEFE